MQAHQQVLPFFLICHAVSTHHSHICTNSHHDIGVVYGLAPADISTDNTANMRLTVSLTSTLELNHASVMLLTTHLHHIDVNSHHRNSAGLRFVLAVASADHSQIQGRYSSTSSSKRTTPYHNCIPTNSHHHMSIVDQTCRCTL